MYENTRPARITNDAGPGTADCGDLATNHAIQRMSTTAWRGRIAPRASSIGSGSSRLFTNYRPQPNGSRLSCGALKNNSFPNLRRAASFKRLLGSKPDKSGDRWLPNGHGTGWRKAVRY